MRDVNAVNDRGISRRRLMRGVAGSAVALSTIGNLHAAGKEQAAGGELPNVLRDAAWLRDPRTAGFPLGELINRRITMVGTLPGEIQKVQRCEEIPGAGTPNLHTYFRREVVIRSEIRRATLHITGDDVVKFYINGAFCVQAPEPGYPFAYPYYALDVTRWLRAGTNCLAAHLYYHGVYARAFNSGDNRSGFIAALDVAYADGAADRFVTDASWRCLESTTRTASILMGYGTQFNENMDLRREPRGWREAGFDDRAWKSPLLERQDHVLVPAIAEPLEHWKAEPVTIESRGEGRWFCDMGKEVAGHTCIAVRGPAGHRLTVHHGEELNPDGSVRWRMRCFCHYEDQITLTGEDDVVEFFDYRGFRYIEILNAPEKPRVWVDVRHYPFPADACEFASSDEMHEKIWRMCANGVRMGCQEVYTDCTQREKGQYGGDTYMTALAQLILTGDPSLTRKALRDFQLSQRFDDAFLAVAPGSFHQELAEWSLLWPIMLEHYHEMTGDEAFVIAMARAGLPRFLSWFAQREDDRGLLTGMEREKWVLVDWPQNLRAGYDLEKTKNAANTVINAFYHGMLGAVAKLTKLAGGDATPILARRDRLRGAMQEILIDPGTGLFRDGDNSDRTTLHASAFALRFGVVPDSSRAAVIALIEQQRLNCGLYGAHYFIEALYQHGRPDLGWSLLDSRDKHSWAEMIRNGATAPLEAWAPELKWNTSFCQPCGATPIYLFTRYVMGISPAEPGFNSVRLAPNLPVKLERMRLRFPTVRGPIVADYDRTRGYELTVPRAMRVVQHTPKDLKVVIRQV